MEKERIAHIIRNQAGEIEKLQTVKEHCENVAVLAAGFAKAFGAEDIAYQCGMAHDIGKYSDKFQHRILDHGPATDHSTAGAKEIFQAAGALPAYCVAGHHSGLADGGGKFNSKESGTLFGRLKKDVEDYSAFQNEISIRRPANPPLTMLGEKGFTCSFFVRMLFSCLVDADFLDTELFMSNGKISRRSGETVEVLKRKMDQYLEENHLLKGEGRINQKRSEILRNCIQIGKEAKPGLFTLTVPTGGGKTISSLAFALKHALQNKKQRVIYVIPYCSVIDQTVMVFSSILGEENVLAHYSEAQYNDDEKEEMNRKRLAAENWDAPVIVTTAVQFFESLFSNRPSACRKLHNISNSVVIFDEAQTLPFDFLKPCVDAIAELTVNYSATCVLCTATQPALRNLFHEYACSLSLQEICQDTQGLYDFFRRVTYRKLGQLTDDELVLQLEQKQQVLCIVSTKAQARNIMELLGEDAFHLSTFMTPEHRREVLVKIKKRLACSEPCRVVSTSLIEAGVDLDFPVVYRTSAGLDSEIQAGGRCNREGKKKPEDSMVYIFRQEDKYRMPASMRKLAEEMEQVTRGREDIDSPCVIQEYFLNLYHDSADGIDKKQIVKRFEEGFLSRMSFPFASAAKDFHLIDDYSKTILIPRNQESRELADRLETGSSECNKELFRKMGHSCVNVTSKQFEQLRPALNIIDESIAVLESMELYDEKTGIKAEFEGGYENVF